jgi:nitrite reductase/ring-hydroxylating ferredoxin subunit
MFVDVGSLDGLGEGQMTVVQVAGTDVTLARIGRQTFAFDDTCTHAGCSLSDGDLEGTTVTCPCHGSQFDVTSGAVIRGPAERPVRSRAVTLSGDRLLVED